MVVHQDITYPNIGPRDSYLMHHEELESLVKNYPTIKRARFWMTFGQQYLTYLDCIQNLGMSRIDEIEYEAPLADGSGKTVKVKIVPLQFLKAVLPNHRTSVRTMMVKLLSAAVFVVSRMVRNRLIISITTVSIRMPIMKQVCRALAILLVYQQWLVQ